jgi:hypothetical protein
MGNHEIGIEISSVSFNFLRNQTERNLKKSREKVTYRIGIGTEQLHGSVNEVVPRSYVNHCVQKVIKVRELLDFHKWGTAVDTVLVKKKKKAAQGDFAGI